MSRTVGGMKPLAQAAALVAALVVAATDALVVGRPGLHHLQRSRPFGGVVTLQPLPGCADPRRRRDVTCVRMGWGGDVSFAPVEVLSNEPAGTGLRAVAISVSPATAAAFETPGQFVQIRPGEGAKPGFYAIASPPRNDTAVFEFLVKQTDTNAWLTEAKAGAPLEMSGVAGNGFDVDKLEGLTLFDGFQCMNRIFLAQGTGIAPIRSAIEHGVGLGLPKPATLYYGVRDDEHKAYADKFDEWLSEYNVEVIECQSQPLPGYTGLTGYVQDVLKARGVAVPRNTGACLCGNKDFFMANKDILLEAGVFEGRILSNF